jgi:quinol monooxygenase YgiN
MMRHIVLLRFRKDIDADRKRALFRQLEDLRRHIPGTIGFHAGRNESVEGELMRGNLDGFWFDFENEQVRDAYLVHPLHQAAGAALVDACEGGIDGITVFDMKV